MALDPNKITLCWPNVIEKATLYGGNYVSTLPLANAAERVFARIAKTTDLDPASTQFTINLNSGLPANLNTGSPVSVIAIAAHNFSATSKYRVRVYQEPDKALLMWDSGVRDVWPVIFDTEELQWEYDNYWSGNLKEEDRGAYTPLLTCFLDEMQMAQCIVVELFDPDNPDGFLTFGRVFAGNAWQPGTNASWGITHGLSSDTDVEETLDRTEYFDVKPLRRTVQFSLEDLSESEAFNRIMRMQRTQGVHKEVLYSFNLHNNPQHFTRTFVGRLVELDPLAHPYWETHTATINLLEIV